jgi:hypothetical protein
MGQWRRFVEMCNPFGFARGWLEIGEDRGLRMGSGTRPTGPRLQEEEIFHDLVDFFFDEGARRNMLLSR